MHVPARLQTDEDRRRLRGPGMLVVDRAPETVEEVLRAAQARVEAAAQGVTLPPYAGEALASLAGVGSWYVVESGRGGPLMMVDINTVLSGQTGPVLGVVLFLARPPLRDTNVQGTDMLQV